MSPVLRSTPLRSPGPAPHLTRGPRRRRTAVVLASLGTLLAACAGDPEATPDGAAPTDEAAPDEAPCFAQIHGEAGFAGESACLPLGAISGPELAQLGLAGAELRSLTLEPGHRLTVWTDGAAAPFQTATSVAEVALAGRVTRVELGRCVAGLFTGADGQGAGACLEPGRHDAASLAALRLAQVRSVVIAPGYRAAIARDVAGRPEVTEARGTLDLPLEAGAALTSIDLAIDDAPPAPTAVPAAAKPDITSFDRVYILGDSLSDQQNQRSSSVPRCPNQHLGYWNGRFTNGYNWVDFMSQDNPGLAAIIANKAVGGSKVEFDAIARPSVQTQASRLIAALPAATRRARLADSLVIIWAGANDVRDTSAKSSPGDATKFADKIAAKLQTTVTTLTNAGVKNVMIIGVPEIDRVPVARKEGWSAARKTWVSTAVKRINFKIVVMVLSGGHLWSNVPAMINDWLDHRRVSVNMMDTTTECIGSGACDFTAAGNYVEKTCTKKMFFDPLHPTSGAHCGVAKHLEQTLAIRFGIRGSTDSIESCARRRLAAAFGGVPARLIRFDVQRAPITSGPVAAASCPSLCSGAGATWNGNWTNYFLPRPVSEGGRYQVGVCGCDKR
jgi:lysophospholipase L1-like esterase